MSQRMNSMLRVACLVALLGLIAAFSELVSAGNLPFLWMPLPTTEAAPDAPVTPKVRVQVYGEFTPGACPTSLRLRSEWDAMPGDMKRSLPFVLIFDESVPVWVRVTPTLHWQDDAGEWHRWHWHGRAIREATLCADFLRIYSVTERYVAATK